MTTSEEFRVAQKIAGVDAVRTGWGLPARTPFVLDEITEVLSAAVDKKRRRELCDGVRHHAG